MSTMQRISLIGLYNYDSHLFDSLSLPEKYDKPTFINSLLLEHGEKCVLYTDPDFMKTAIGIWSNKWGLELSRIFEALTAEYNPIYNYDRYEESSDGRGKKLTSTLHAGTAYTSNTSGGHKASDKPKYDDDLTNDYDVTVQQTVSGNVEHQVAADNSSTYQPDSKDISDGGTTVTGNDGTIKRHIEGTTQDLSETFNNKTEDSTTNNSSKTDQETENLSHTAHLYGNIGVTTSASMVTEVIEQRMKYNLYAIATRLFASELLIGIY